MDNKNTLTKEGNPFIKRANQKKQYAKMIWPIPELEESFPFYRDEIGEALATIAFAIHDTQQREQKCRLELMKSRDEVREEFKAEIEALQDELNRSYMRLSEKEDEAYHNFITKHYKLHNDGKYKRDEGIIVHMVGTGVGTCYRIECPICHESEDITDVSNW